jgi:hypothetical protein
MRMRGETLETRPGCTGMSLGDVSVLDRFSGPDLLLESVEGVEVDKERLDSGLLSITRELRMRLGA